MTDCRLGFYFARVDNSDKITTVACWGDRVEKEEKEGVEVLEQVPTSVVKHCRNGVRILNLNKIIRGLE